MNDKLLRPDYIFETSWEVCNKVGGIYTVLSTKAQQYVKTYKSNYILIGPDVWRDTAVNPLFVEDTSLFKSWRAKAKEDGLQIRIGRWNIEGSPIAIIVDFQSFTPYKDQIFAKFWETYKLDSISGQWDYIESALFGYAAGKVIESFVRYHLTGRDRIIAHFHEWMTGAGILYLKSAMPQIGTIFTTHATVLGRCIAGNQLPLYGPMTQYNPDGKAAEYQVAAKHSLEKTAAHAADCFTTVSGITAKECEHFLGKKVDIVTPNGFEDSFVPQGKAYETSRSSARGKLREVAAGMFGSVSDDAMFVAIGGRYEYKNKGIDLFINALGRLNKMSGLKREVIAFMLIPANHYEARKDLQQILATPGMANSNGRILTHNLHDAEYDPILNQIKAEGFTNTKEKVKIIFVPCYLNGNDGIFNMTYYQLLIGMDMTAFPSYYEPWGYTTLESVAFHVPTVTTSVAGFGAWIKDRMPDAGYAASVLDRTDTNDAAAAGQLADIMLHISQLDQQAAEALRQRAYEVSRIALWSNFIIHYDKAFDIALQKIQHMQQNTQEIDSTFAQTEQYSENAIPKWKRLIVNKNIPESLEALEKLANNLWWCWNYEAEELFEEIDPALWKVCEKNPVVFLGKIPYAQFKALEKNKAFMAKLDKVYAAFTAYMDEKKKQTGPSVAYFSMEYGLHASLKIYSGGLGILAGDYLKEASDMNIRMSAVGLLYRYGYFHQVIMNSGDQIERQDAQDFTKIPAIPMRDADGSWSTVSIVVPGRSIHARIWKVEVGRVDLYLLDTDYEENTEADRSITHHLYGGGEEMRFKQELLLGIGGIRALRRMNINADVYHCNEGHAAFIGLERLYEYITKRNLTFSEALEIIRSSSLFTTHTPVPAGHDSFDEGMLRMYISHYPQKLKISWERFMGLGRINAKNSSERFSMSFLAANLSQEVNGVSRLHGKVSQSIFAPMWPGYLAEEINIGYVTNGVHVPTWATKRWKQLYAEYLSDNFLHDQLNKENWNKIQNVPDEEIWSMLNEHRKMTINFIKDRMRLNMPIRTHNPKYLMEVAGKLNPNTLTIGFARRFATYKRALLLFSDIDRLARIVNNPAMPVQFIFAGKAHPADQAGKDLIKRIVEYSKRPEFLGKIIFIQNYDMEVARYLVSGVDVWLNTPTRPLEASGTSGEKAVMNGTLHFSVLDGWWAEGYRKEAGWMLPEEITYDNNDAQNELDAEMIYSLIENEVAPLYYTRNENDVPVKWVQYVKNSIAQVASNFTTTRMLDDYIRQYYLPLSKRKAMMLENEFMMAKTLASWKKKIIRGWDSIEVLSIKTPDIFKESIVVGKVYPSEVVLDLKELSSEDIGVEAVFVYPASEGKPARFIKTVPYTLAGVSGKTAIYRTDLQPDKTGVYDFGIRVYPTNKNLAHRQDFGIVKWI